MYKREDEATEFPLQQVSKELGKRIRSDFLKA